MRPHPRTLAFVIVLGLAIVPGVTRAVPFEPAKVAEGRLLAFISDLHMNVGKVGGRWHPYEDFRWPNALRGLLEEIDRQGKGHTDLVIVGDFLELWQLPDDIACRGSGSDLGCTPAEMAEITRRVLAGHADVIDLLRAFSVSGDNRLYVLPGNHDAALTLPEVRSLVEDALDANSGRVSIPTDGFYSSADGYIVVEHGHQIPGDANRYPSWPDVQDAASGLIRRPFGELFVQRLFNDAERNYPIIDNLAPESAGAWYRMQDRGLWRTVGDAASLVSFFLFETSRSQKIGVLGDGADTERASTERLWDVAFARGLGYELYAHALPANDALRTALLSGADDTEIVELRRSLSDLAADTGETSDAQIRQLCDQMATQSSKRCLDPGTLGETASSIPGVRPWLLKQHLLDRRKVFPQMSFFIYGHTHKYEVGHSVAIEGNDKVQVYNTGAFQRLIDKDQYLTRLAAAYPGTSPADGLARFSLEDDLPPCYTVVLAPWTGTYNEPKTWRWHMPEDGTGRLIEPEDGACG